MKKLSLIIAAVFVFGVANAVVVPTGDTDEATHNLTVNVPLFALVDVEDDGNPITLSPGVSEEAGKPLNFNVASATNSSAYLNYTSVIGENGGNNGNQYGNSGKGSVTSRKVTAKINTALDGTGVAIKVEAAAYSGNGSGVHGSSAGAKVLKSSEALEIVTGIGSSYTGDGENNGHKLTYSLVQVEDKNGVNYGALASGSYGVEITYTITD